RKTVTKAFGVSDQWAGQARQRAGVTLDRIGFGPGSTVWWLAPGYVATDASDEPPYLNDKSIPKEENLPLGMDTDFRYGGPAEAPEACPTCGAEAWPARPDGWYCRNAHRWGQSQAVEVEDDFPPLEEET